MRWLLDTDGDPTVERERLYGFNSEISLSSAIGMAMESLIWASLAKRPMDCCTGIWILLRRSAAGDSSSLRLAQPHAGSG